VNPTRLCSLGRTIWFPVVGLLLCCALAAPQASAQTCHGPGTERWPIKVSVAAGADVSNPKTVNLDALLALEDVPGVRNNDSRFQATRIPAFTNSLNAKEGDILQTTGWLYLADLKQTLSTLRDFIKTKILKGNEPSNTGSVMVHPVCVRVAGQLFYDDAHLKKNGESELRGKKGMSSKTLWELHPITNFQIVQSTACNF